MVPLLPRDCHLCVSGLNFKILLLFAFSRIHTQFSETAALTISLVFWGFAFSAVRCWSPTSLFHPNGCPELSVEAGFLHCFPQKESQPLVVFPTWTWGYITVGSLNPSSGSPWASACGWHFRSFLGLYRRQVFALCLSSLACCLLRRMASGWPMAVPAVYGIWLASCCYWGVRQAGWSMAVCCGIRQAGWPPGFCRLPEHIALMWVLEIWTQAVRLGLTGPSSQLYWEYFFTSTIVTCHSSGYATFNQDSNWMCGCDVAHLTNDLFFSF